MAIEEIPYNMPSVVYNYFHVEADNNTTFDSSHGKVHATVEKNVYLDNEANALKACGLDN